MPIFIALKKGLVILFLLVIARVSAQSDTLLPLVSFQRNTVIDSWLSSQDNSRLPGVNYLTSAPVAVYFERSSKRLSIAAENELNKVIDQMARNKNVVVLLTGHADRRRNMNKSWRRSAQYAKATRAFLLEAGFDPSRVIMKYVGDQGSLSRDPGNRRVDVEFISLP